MHLILNRELATKKRFEHPCAFLLWNAGTFILDASANRRFTLKCRTVCGDADASVLLAPVLDRVLEQISQGVLQRFFVGFDEAMASLPATALPDCATFLMAFRFMAA